MTVFKAHITTNPASDVLDMFWIYDNRHELPDHHRRDIANLYRNSLCPLESDLTYMSHHALALQASVGTCLLAISPWAEAVLTERCYS